MEIEEYYNRGDCVKIHLHEYVNRELVDEYTIIKMIGSKHICESTKYMCKANTFTYEGMTNDIVSTKDGEYIHLHSLATPEETYWLDKCISANKFISKEEALKDFNNKIELNYEIY